MIETKTPPPGRDGSASRDMIPHSRADEQAEISPPVRVPGVFTLPPPVEQSGLGALDDFMKENAPTPKPPAWWHETSARDLVARPPRVKDWFMESCFKAGDTVEVVGPSKIGKTWFLLGLAVHLAAGHDFMGIRIPKPRRVRYLNLEVAEDDFQSRLQGEGPRSAMLDAYGLPETALDNLAIVSCRGHGEELRELLENDAALVARGVDVVIVDPKYKLMVPGEDENSAVGLGPLLACFDRLAEAGPAVVYVTHDGKGYAGERDKVDRGAGSGITGRDYDCRICLTRHAEADDENRLVVVSFSCRSAREPADMTLRFECPALVPCPDILPEVETQATRSAKSRPSADTPPAGCDAVRRVLATEPDGLSRSAIVNRAEAAGLATEYHVRAALRWMGEHGQLTSRKGAKNAMLFSLVELENPKSPTSSNFIQLTPGELVEMPPPLKKGEGQFLQHNAPSPVSTANLQQEIRITK